MKHYVLLLFATSALLAQTPPPHPAWNGDKVHEIRLRFKQADFWAQLTKNYLGTEVQAEYLEGSLEWGPYKFDSVGVRFKGNSSYSGARTLKKPFRIKLNEYVKGQKIEGIGAFNLSNGLNDPSLVRESLYYEIAVAFGLKAPRANYAALYINDQYYGLYVLGEVVNGDFLKNYFGKGEDSGNLYKANIGASFDYLGEDKAKYKEVWEKQTNEEADDWADLIELCEIIGQTPAADLKAKLEPLMDIDSALAALALDNLTVNLDSYVGLGQNFNIYRRPSDKRWVWLVWDPSLAFGAFPGGATGQGAVELVTEYVQARGGLGGGLPPGGIPPGGAPGGNAAPATRPLATKLWAVPEYLERYRQIYRAYVDRGALSAQTIQRAQTLRDMIRPYVLADTQLLNTKEQFEAAMTAPIANAPAPGQPGPGAGGGGLNGASAPGLEPLIEGRRTWLKTKFDAQPVSAAVLNASAATLNFAAAAGGTAPATQRIDLNYTGVKTAPSYSVYAATQNGGNWLTPSITGGPLPGAFSVAVSATGLGAGVYAGSVSVYLPGAPDVVIPVTLTVGALAVPTVTGIVNAASYSTGPIAPGQFVTIFGANLGPAMLSSNSSGVRVTFDGVAGEVLYVSGGQIGVSVPVSIAGKTQTTVLVSYGNQTSAPVNKAVAPTAPALFTTNASGTGPGAIVNQAGTLNSSAAPAPKGSLVSLYLTGAGLTSANGTISAPVMVAIGGQAAVAAYAGLAGGSTLGLYQVNVTIPAAIASGAQPVVVTIGGVASAAGVTVAVQ